MTTSTRKLVRRVACPLLLLLASVGSAAGQTTKLSASEIDGRARFEEGVRLAETGDHERARLKFVQAWALLKYSTVLFNLARAEQLSGHDVDALRHYRQFATSTDPKIAPAQRELARTNATELTKSVGQLALDVAPGATISVDGERVESELSEPVPVAPGAHVVVSSIGGKTKRVSVEAAAGAVTRVSLVDAAPPEPAPAAAPTLPAVNPRVTHEERRSGGYVVPTALAVAGLAGVGIGVAFALKSDAAKDDSNALGKPLVCIDRAAAACRTYVDAHDSVHKDATVAWVGYIAGGVLLAGAVGSFLFWPKEKKTTGFRVVPVVGPRTATAVASFAF